MVESAVVSLLLVVLSGGMAVAVRVAVEVGGIVAVRCVVVRREVNCREVDCTEVDAEVVSRALLDRLAELEIRPAVGQTAGKMPPFKTIPSSVALLTSTPKQATRTKPAVVASPAWQAIEHPPAKSAAVHSPISVL